jgi:DNA-binding transcriptional regulator YiaG
LSDEVTLELSFKDIEAILGSPLPKSARTSGAFWSNRTSGALQAKAWMDAGYHAIEIDIAKEKVTFSKPTLNYEIRKVGDTILWTGSMVRALRFHLGMSQAELSNVLGVRQQTISEWENQIYLPSRGRSKHLQMVAEKSGLYFEKSGVSPKNQND